MSLYSDHVNANCAEIDEPAPYCPNCGFVSTDEYELRGACLDADGYGPFPVYRCLACGAEVVWE